MKHTEEELSIINTTLQRAWRRTVGRAHWSRPTLSWPRLYGVAALVLLVVTTIWWAICAAGVEFHNADQLVDPYLFQDHMAFRGAVFPAAHTFLLKWPIFWLISLFGVSRNSLLVATVGVSLLTVGAFAYLLYRIERRSLVLGTVYAALALVLLLVPPQPYGGSLLPLNMAMLTTRNIEYIWYIAALVCCITATRLRSRWFALGTGLLAVLVVSDKLFLAFSMGGAGLALLVYVLRAQWHLAQLAARWFVATVAAFIGAAVITGLITGLHITHLSTSSSISPYATGGGIKGMVLGVSYGLLGFLANFGANPAPGNRTLSTLPRELLHGLGSVTGLLSVAAVLIVAVCLVAVWRVGYPSLGRQKVSATASRAPQLALLLIWSTIAAGGVFVVSQHYYAVDGRYLTIGLFALFVSAVTVLRTSTIARPRGWVIGGATLAVLAVVASWSTHAVAAQQTNALARNTGRDDIVAQMLKAHKVDVLLGDYWRVLPVRADSGGTQNVLPLANCTMPAGSLISSRWQPDLTTHSFAYLISFDGSFTGFPACTLPQISQQYGRPNAVQVVAGTLAAPKEALLFYDHGSHPPVATLPSPAAAPLLPLAVDQLTKTNCSQPTSMNIVAHEDDDILFMNPDILHDIRAGNCVRTIYLTAGDSGYGKYYWLSRQLGSEAAYSTMLGIQDVWDQQIVTLPGGQYVTIASPRGNSQVSLIFLNLPDGNVQGDGFPDTHHESLGQLYGGSLAQIHAIDGQSSYGSDQLVEALMSLMDTYQPALVRTQATVASADYPDHSDHVATSRFTDLAVSQYDQQHFAGSIAIPVQHYVGYPVRDQSPDVSGQDLADKQTAFFAYAKYDGGVCGSIERCAHVPTYNEYLSREYRSDDE